MGFLSPTTVGKMMDSVKQPNHIVLPTKFKIIGYNYRVENGYQSIEFQILPIDDIKADDLLKWSIQVIGVYG